MEVAGEERIVIDGKVVADILNAQIKTLKAERDSLAAELINAKSTIEGLKNLDAMVCGCRYNKIWGGMKWEHYLVACKEHSAKRVERLETALRECARNAHSLHVMPLNFSQSFEECTATACEKARAALEGSTE